MRTLRSRLPILVAERQITTGKKITQKDIAIQTDLNESVVSRLMNADDVQRIEAATAAAICEYFDCDLGDLFTFLSEQELQQRKHPE